MKIRQSTIKVSYFLCKCKVLKYTLSQQKDPEIDIHQQLVGCWMYKEILKNRTNYRPY